MGKIEETEVVFEHDDEKYVVEYDMSFDKDEFFVDVLRIEAYSSDARLTQPIVKKALLIAYNHGKREWEEWLDMQDGGF